jgi:hypothetical protein
MRFRGDVYAIDPCVIRVKADSGFGGVGSLKSDAARDTLPDLLAGGIGARLFSEVLAGSSVGEVGRARVEALSAAFVLAGERGAGGAGGLGGESRGGGHA